MKKRKQVRNIDLTQAQRQTFGGFREMRRERERDRTRKQRRERENKKPKERERNTITTF